ncbi:MAG: hypothetical protein ACO3GP_01230 [Candidatus Limnocylindrus sp.]|jgi:hypothetical protein
MKKNGQHFLETYDRDDARAGWKFPSGGGKDIDAACNRWLEKNTPPSKKKKRRFGNY